MSDLIVGLYEDWLGLDERIETVSREIEEISQQDANCIRLMSVPGVGPLISAQAERIVSSARSRAEQMTGDEILHAARKASAKSV